MDIAIPAPYVIAQLEKRLISEFALAVEEWTKYICTLTKWEDDHLLENASAESLAAHRQMVERLLGFGRFIGQTTQQPEFPDRKTAELVAITQTVLNDKLLMWHRPRMNKEEADRILSVCFPNES